jgi:hypothetical protein
MNSELDAIVANLDAAGEQACAVAALISLLTHQPPGDGEADGLASASEAQKRAILELRAEPAPTPAAAQEAMDRLAMLDSLLLRCIEQYAERCRSIADHLALLEEFEFGNDDVTPRPPLNHLGRSCTRNSGSRWRDR